MAQRTVAAQADPSNAAIDTDSIRSSNGYGEDKIHSSVWVNHEAIPAYFAPVSLRLVLIGWSLGALFGVCIAYAIPVLSPTSFSLSLPSLALQGQYTAAHLAAVLRAPQLHLYLAAWSTFHLFEFLVTAHWNPTRLMKDSFLLQNGWNYHAAHLFGLAEFLLESFFLPSLKLNHATARGAAYVGILCVLVGQYLRSTAMIHASSNFSHQVAHKKRHDHQLVTTGVYAFARHPSYSGFFIWALGTQVLLANPIAGFIFAVVLWRFFSSRIKTEEASLIHFFGDDYRNYRSRVWSGIPLV